MLRCKLSFAKSRFVIDPACGAGRERPKPGTRPQGGESKRSADKFLGVTAKERYLREAYNK
jgi:hypothetical protein